MNFDGYVLKRHDQLRDTYVATTPNSKHETLTVELIRCDTPTGKNGEPSSDSLPALWKKHGFRDDVLLSWWHVTPEVTDETGVTRFDYNPQVTPEHQLDHAYVREATEENAVVLMSEIYKRFMSA